MSAHDDKRGEVEIGYYVEIKRGSWAKENGKLAQTFPASGLSYSGSLTKEQMEGIDGLIRDYLEGKTTPSHALENAQEDCPHGTIRYGGTGKGPCHLCEVDRLASVASTTPRSVTVMPIVHHNHEWPKLTADITGMTAVRWKAADGSYRWMLHAEAISGKTVSVASAIAPKEIDPYKRNPKAGLCECALMEVPAGCDGVQWYWQRHARDGCTLELPNIRCWCGLLRSEHVTGHDESKRHLLNNSPDGGKQT